MDNAQRVAHELNRGSNLTSDFEDDCSDDEDNELDYITLENIPSLELTLAKDDEESLGLAAQELDRRISDTISVVTFEGDKDSEMEKIRNFDCKCYTRRKENSIQERQSCSHKLSPEVMYSIRMDSLAAEREWQDMRIIGHLEANRRSVSISELTTSTKKAQLKRKRARTTFSIGGNEVCKNTFLFLMG
ncbi:uncharacterized protein LOC125271036 [Scomber scombrus]|uniref:Uncharacterized protein LOC125271036 n=1 Tax=Scomber scombrus TaxID=13677 RepID=A0AAV1PME7_SCOSC